MYNFRSNFAAAFASVIAMMAREMVKNNKAQIRIGRGRRSVMNMKINPRSWSTVGPRDMTVRWTRQQERYEARVQAKARRSAEKLEDRRHKKLAIKQRRMEAARNRANAL